MPKELPKTFDFAGQEDAIYKTWEDSGFFNPDNLPGQRNEAFSISMPPPNATGVLHTGHAVMLAIQDIITRYQRMAGKKTLWLPGTDHAAIATQTKVEKLVYEKEQKTRHDLGRDAFLEKVRAFVADSQDTIRKQVRKMGSSCDWSRERYTLDEGLTQAVNEAFVRMYADELIYRGYRIVNWCPRCKSTLADDEVEYKEEHTKFYYFKYGPVVIGTARPETKFGDKVIIVHPDDPRFKEMVGKEFDVEWILGPIKAKVIADPVADMSMGSGAMTITPAHSFVDFELAQKYNLPIEKIIDENGTITNAGGEGFAGLSVKEARKKVVEVLQAKGLIESIDENYRHNLSVCYRCGTPIEPLPSRQWFLDVNKKVANLNNKSIKECSVEVVRNGEIKIIPERFEKTYYHWMENLRDWCISRQIWFGHRIPVWYKKDDHEQIHVGVTPPDTTNWEQDPDTLDTWFSSGLWTFSTLGWPKQTNELKTFHPTGLMETGYDILFFWVARMIIMSTYLMQQVPFKTVYLHGLVRDEQGRKMSKSLGNIIDPLDVIAKYGADALRLSLVIGTTPGNDMNLGDSKISGYRNFVTKLWNISRYVLMTVEQPRIITKQPEPKTDADRWILAELNTLINTATNGLEKYTLSAVGEKIYEFTWSQFAGWYLEIAKIEKDKDDLLLYILQTVLRLWHPFCPFVTEQLWKELGSNELLMVQEWPTNTKIKNTDTASHERIAQMQAVIGTIRNLKNEYKISDDAAVVTIVGTTSDLNTSGITDFAQHITSLSRSAITFDTQKPTARAVSAIASSFEVYMALTDNFDTASEITRLQKERTSIEKYISGVSAKLNNQQFVANAPAEIVSGEKQKLAEANDKLEKIQRQLKDLQ